MAASVAGIIERQLSTIAGISSMSSSRRRHKRHHHPVRPQSQHRCPPRLTSDGADDRAAPAADRMTIPPSFRKVNPADFPVLFVVLRSATLPLSAVHEYGDITKSGKRCHRFQVSPRSISTRAKIRHPRQADPQAAARRGLSLEDIRAAVARANSSTRSNAERTRSRMSPSASGRWTRRPTTSDVVAWRNGSPVKLDEVARNLRQRGK